MRIEGSSIPFHIARAYGVAQAVRPRSLEAIEPTEHRQRPDTAELASASRLVAARVAGNVDFTAREEAPRATEAPIAFYRHPADKNAAATGVEAGRTLDVTG